MNRPEVSTVEAKTAGFKRIFFENLITGGFYT